MIESIIVLAPLWLPILAVIILLFKYPLPVSIALFLGVLYFLLR